MTCPDSPADVENHLARVEPRLGATYGVGLDYRNVGLMLDRLSTLAEVWEERPLLPWSHLKMIAQAVIPLSG